MSYDRSLSLFSPTGQISQIDYAGEAVRLGLACVGVKGKDHIVLACEKKSVQKLMDPRTVRKVYHVDQHCAAAFAGLSADARVLMNRVQLQCQSHRLTYEDRMDVDQIVRALGTMLQQATQSGGRRPYGVGVIVAGFNERDGTPQLWMTEPSGQVTAWKACVCGGKSKEVHDCLESNWKPDLTRDGCIKLALRGLLEVVDSGANNLELTVIGRGDTFENVDEEQIATLCKQIDKEMEEERARKKREMADD